MWQNITKICVKIFWPWLNQFIFFLDSLCVPHSDFQWFSPPLHICFIWCFIICNNIKKLTFCARSYVVSFSFNCMCLIFHCTRNQSFNFGLRKRTEKYKLKMPLMFSLRLLVVSLRIIRKMDIMCVNGQ